MQTFLPYPDFQQSARSLDFRRLGKQRVEAFQLLLTNNNPWAIIERAKRTQAAPRAPIINLWGWRNHPAAKMWKSYDDALGLYMNTMIREWIARGYKNTMSLYPTPQTITFPKWLGNPDFHRSHRASLSSKNPKHYSQYWNEPTALPYVWIT